MDAISSPLPGTISSVGTPESLSSADSPSFSFQPVDSPSSCRVISNGDDPMLESNEQTKTTTSELAQNNQSNESDQSDLR